MIRCSRSAAVLEGDATVPSQRWMLPSHMAPMSLLMDWRAAERFVKQKHHTSPSARCRGSTRIRDPSVEDIAREGIACGSDVVSAVNMCS